MPPVTRRRAASARSKRRASGKVRVVKGRVKLRVAGYSGLQSLSPSHLVRQIPAAKLRLAAKKVLRLTKKKATKTKRRRRKGTKRKARRTKRRKGAKKGKKRRRRLRRKTT